MKEMIATAENGSICKVWKVKDGFYNYSCELKDGSDYSKDWAPSLLRAKKLAKDLFVRYTNQSPLPRFKTICMTKKDKEILEQITALVDARDKDIGLNNYNHDLVSRVKMYLDSHKSLRDEAVKSYAEQRKELEVRYEQGRQDGYAHVTEREYIKREKLLQMTVQELVNYLYDGE